MNTSHVREDRMPELMMSFMAKCFPKLLPEIVGFQPEKLIAFTRDTEGWIIWKLWPVSGPCRGWEPGEGWGSFLEGKAGQLSMLFMIVVNGKRYLEYPPSGIQVCKWLCWKRQLWCVVPFRRPVKFIKTLPPNIRIIPEYCFVSWKRLSWLVVMHPLRQ